MRILLCSMARFRRWPKLGHRIEPLRLQRLAVEFSLTGRSAEAAVSKRKKWLACGNSRPGLSSGGNIRWVPHFWPILPEVGIFAEINSNILERRCFPRLAGGKIHPHLPEFQPLTVHAVHPRVVRFE